MCDHDPPRLGAVITPGPATDSIESQQRLRPHSEHSALEARGLSALRVLPALAGSPQAGELSGRQVEIVSRLIAGQRVDDIARGLYLSTSTVRNHLTAIYRKLGVHSQAELLALLLRATAADRERHA